VNSYNEYGLILTILTFPSPELILVSINVCRTVPSLVRWAYSFLCIPFNLTTRHVVTGASTGLGLAIVKQVLEQGERAAATLRSPEVLSSLEQEFTKDQLVPIRLDVTKQEDVSQGFSKAREHFGRVDVVFNNASVAITGEFEGTSEEVACHLFEVCSDLSMDYSSVTE
jgi:enoyl-[acyl-carrier-protein] reductase (NADH)